MAMQQEGKCKRKLTTSPTGQRIGKCTHTHTLAIALTPRKKTFSLFEKYYRVMQLMMNVFFVGSLSVVVTASFGKKFPSRKWANFMPHIFQLNRNQQFFSHCVLHFVGQSKRETTKTT